MTPVTHVTNHARALLAWMGRPHPVVHGVDYWSDGDHLWFIQPSESTLAQDLWNSKRCAAWIPGDDPSSRGALIRGDATVFGLHDPVGLTVHAPWLGLATAGLVLRHADRIAGRALDLIDEPSRAELFRVFADRVLIRLSLDSAEFVVPPMPGLGISPALPVEVPPELRRGISSTRHAVLVMAVNGVLGMLPVVWGPGFTLTLPAGMRPTNGAPSTVAVERHSGARPSETAGISLSGTLSTSGPAPKLNVVTAAWWDGMVRDYAPVASISQKIVIPD